jgi:hypothetical protein
VKVVPEGIKVNACWMPASAVCRAEVPVLRLEEALRVMLVKSRLAPVIESRRNIIMITTTSEIP